ncbi:MULTISPECIES: type VI secretion system tip protein VgrG [unclassified Pseudovibrio]|uniref:type VI secretion system Vgr family protein n=1 Tax=unclassified Pseudovibrio TaxID=2627060 RepID=UPI0007B17A1A|nr:MULTISPECIES: type VI secretion system tip protein VgrG [unclassified Pseudovibrio]KZK94485.1 Phage-related baseplate assembly protein [Pseudovibrio sp. W74]KZL07247.1 Phage-related baseplate assembly protein [Pseudovibrio sp. Ad14]
MNAIVQIPQLFQEQDLAFTFAAPAQPNVELLVTGFSATERLNGLTQIQIELASHDNALDLHSLLDTPASLTIHHKYEGLRHLSGVVAEIARGNEGHHRTSYSLTLLPSLHRLAHGSDCRIFQKKSVPEIVKILLKEHGVEDVKWDLTDTHAAREYCVQYRESHLSFLDRITAEEGIWYYFTYGANGQHTLQFIDNPQIVSQLPDQPKLEYNAMAGGAVKGVYCNSFVLREQLRATSFMQRDYSFKNPPYNQQHAHQRGEDNGSAGDYALYEYPGRYKADGVGKPFTKHRLEAARVEATTGHGATNAIHLTAGHQFALTDHPNDDYNIKYHLLTVSHQGSQPQAVAEEAGSGTTIYSAGFEVMPARLPYRPKLLKKPLVDGPQIAHVTGPEGEEIYCDEHGRVKVWFPWDRHGKKNDTSSCWIRVSSNWAGASWGHIAIPRIGHEVIVDFLEGDPDQPIITGRTYHNNNKSPYQLPDHKTKMVIRSDSHKGDGFNEISFEDQSGEEQIYVHAQKDQDIHVENNRAKRVDVNQSESIGHNKSIEVGNSHHEVIGGNMTLMVGPNKLQQFVTEKFKAVEKALGKKIGGIAGTLGKFGLNMGEGNLVIGVGKNKAETVMATSSEFVGTVKVMNVGAGYQRAVGGMMNSSIAMGKYEDVGMNKTTVVGKRYEIVCGGCKIVMNSDGTMLIEAEKELVLKGGKIKLN